MTKDYPILSAVCPLAKVLTELNHETRVWLMAVMTKRESIRKCIVDVGTGVWSGGALGSGKYALELRQKRLR